MAMSVLPHPSQHRAWIEVNLSAIENNVRAFVKMMRGRGEVMCCVKADAYGHGSIGVSLSALNAGAGRLGVATVEEGEELRLSGITAPIHILGATLPEEVRNALAHNLTISIHDLELANLLSVEACRLQKPAQVNLKIDTGMGRLGILPRQAVETALTVDRLPGVELTGVFTHFAEAEDQAYSEKQITLFDEVCRELERKGIRPPLKHAANTTAAILYPEARHNLIRPGLGLYGCHNLPELAEKIELQPALTWKCVVVHLKDYPAGANLGYNRTFTTQRPTRIAVLPLGYADGYVRALSNHAEVLISGRRAPVVGIISMDYTTVDVTDIPQVEVGSEVTLIGRDGEDLITVEELARHAQTIPYCITAGFGRRPGRCYVR
jgi:alanine racemase